MGVNASIEGSNPSFSVRSTSRPALAGRPRLASPPGTRPGWENTGFTDVGCVWFEAPAANGVVTARKV